jgi:urease accessory protein
MDIIRAPLPIPEHGVIEVLLRADRQTLAKHRWHAAADDGREFGFDLAEPLPDGTPFFYSDGTIYVLAQQPELVLEIPLSSPAVSARMGWLIGNLHFSIEITGGLIRVAEDSALHQMLVREHIPFSEASCVFHPFRSGHVH